MFSIVIPAKNECQNVEPLVGEIYACLDHSYDFEIIFIDDGSDDGTLDEIQRLKSSTYPALRALSHKHSVGQSTAIFNGVKAAKGNLIVTMDADGQNDPANIPHMLELSEHEPDGSHYCIAGYRKNRQDTAWKVLQSRVANAVRSRLLRDGTPDTGCGLKLIPRNTFLQLPYFDHMHRFIPALVKRMGGKVVIDEVNHRPRLHESSKYGMLDRLFTGIVDLIGVMWLLRRDRHTEATEL